MKNTLNWRTFSILLTASIISVIAIFPYILTIQKDLLSQLPISLANLILLQMLQSSVLFAVFVYLGLWLSQKVNLKAPVLQALATNQPIKPLLKKIVPLAAIAGIVTGIVIFLGDALFAVKDLSFSAVQTVPVWQKFLAALYGGIAEEVITRLFLMSLLIWLGKLIFRSAKTQPVVVWIAILLAALLFGAAHLPITATVTELTPLVITRGMILNSIGGIVFGWLYWKKGLETAMIAHFVTDITLLILIPGVVSLFS